MHLNMYAHHIYVCTHNVCKCTYTHNVYLNVDLYLYVPVQSG